MRRHKCVRSRFIAVNNTDVVTQGRKDYSIVSASVGYILETLTLIHIPYIVAVWFDLPICEKPTEIASSTHVVVCSPRPSVHVPYATLGMLVPAAAQT